MRIGLLVSGQLGYEVLYKLVNDWNIACVLTDKNSASIVEFCGVNNIPLLVGNPRKNTFESQVRLLEVDILFSINYIFIIPESLISSAKQAAVNIHGSLLPKYRGRTPHVWAIINNEPSTGITVHLIDSGCDTGAILLQETIYIEYTDTGYDVLQKFKTLYPVLINQTLIGLEENSLNPIPQKNELATYFGKRTPEDGEINWDWQKERIYNWVRAQAKPYPGAFSFYRNKKIIIHKIKFSETGFYAEQTNGTILTIGTEGPIIKTPNGAIELLEIDVKDSISFTIGECLGTFQDIKN